MNNGNSERVKADININMDTTDSSGSIRLEQSITAESSDQGNISSVSSKSNHGTPVKEDACTAESSNRSGTSIEKDAAEEEAATYKAIDSRNQGAVEVSVKSNAKLHAGAVQADQADVNNNDRLSKYDNISTLALAFYFIACFAANYKKFGDFSYANMTAGLSSLSCALSVVVLSILKRKLQKNPSVVDKCKSKYIKDMYNCIMTQPKRSLWYANTIGCIVALVVSVPAFFSGCELAKVISDNASTIWFILYFLVLHYFS